MTLRSKVLLAQFAVVGAVVLLTAAVLVALGRIDYYRGREVSADRQMAEMVAIAWHANAYRARLAGDLLAGAGSGASLAPVRKELEAGFDALDRLIREEVRAVDGRAAKTDEMQERTRVDRLRRLQGKIDAAAARVILLIAEGRRGDAAALFADEIEPQLFRPLDALLVEAMADEREETATATAKAAAVGHELTLWIAGVSVLAIALGLFGGLWLHRSLAQPISRLTEGANAIGRGALDHRIPEAGTDELAVLSRRFNQMADQLETHRRMLFEIQEGLEAQVRERTAAVARANARLLELDGQRLRFLADVSHELRTPLTVLRGEAEITLRAMRAGGDANREVFARIVEKAEQMGRLIDDLLSVARSEAGGAEFQMRRVCLQDVLAQAVEEGAILARGRGIGLGCDAPDAPLYAVADPQRVKQAVLVAIDNAVKYSPDGQTVRVILGRAGAMAQIAIVDHGCGIPESDLSRVFERFYRSPDARGRAISGSGIGLAVAKWIVERHGGHAVIESVPGKETRLTLRFPIGEGEHDADIAGRGRPGDRAVHHTGPAS